MRVPAPPRLAQLAHLFQLSPATLFGNKSTHVAPIRRHQHHQHHQHPFGTSTPLPSPTTSTSSTSTGTNSSASSDMGHTFDAETVMDDRTFVEEESRRRSSSSHSDAEADEASSLILLSDIPEEEVSYLNFKRRRTLPSSSRGRGRGRGPASSSERPDTSARLSIIYPLPSAESLLAVAATHGPTPSATVIDASIAPPLSTPFPLSPPPAHYKRRRARIMSDEDQDSDPSQAPIRFLADSESTLRFPF